MENLTDKCEKITATAKNRGKMLIVDGSSMLTTNYYATLPKSILFAKTDEEKKAYFKDIMQSKDGKYTNAVYSTLKMLLKIYEKQEITHTVVAFDKSRDTFRRTELKADFYKANRGATPQPLREQFVSMESILERIGITVLMCDKYEADDLAGSAAKKVEKDISTYIITKDHDYYQLASEYTRLWMVQTKQEKVDELFELYGVEKEVTNLPDKVFEFTPLQVEGEEGVKPEQIPDLKGIVGDTADNIPGVKGVSSAAPLLLKEYGTVENLYEYMESCTSKKEKDELKKFWKESLGITRSPITALEKYKEDALLSKKLATIVTNVEIKQELEDFTLKINEEELEKVCEEYTINYEKLRG